MTAALFPRPVFLHSDQAGVFDSLLTGLDWNHIAQ